MDQLPRQLEGLIGRAMLRDRPHLRAQAQRLASGEARSIEPGRRRRRRGPPRQLDPARFQAELRQSIAQAQRRATTRPAVTYPPDLPITARREEILRAVADRRVVVVCGETGSGKTTQLPKMLLEAGFGVAGTIGHTQPRRIAARTVAGRIASELRAPLGREVGFKVRFGDRTSPETLIKLMTDGILLAETQRDRDLLAYDALIIDEAHERSLNIDFLLGYLRGLLDRRPDLRLVITSATIEPQRFAEHFAEGGRPAPIIEVSGRGYPIDIRYRPPEGEFAADDLPLDEAIDLAIREAQHEAPGDTLVFLPGEREIRETIKSLADRGWDRAKLLPLYGRLSITEQERIFKGAGAGRIVLATNVAETSVTVPGVRSVVDTGLARISRYSARTKVQHLPVEAVSQASAQQRAGRCGRIGPGVCVRLYSQEDFEQRPVFTDPEISRSNLASVILQMRALRLGAVESFPFVDPPDRRLIRDGYETLRELGALDDRDELTEIGQRLARLPVDPRIGRMILAGAELACLDEVLIIAAALSVQDPRERPHEKAQQADEAHRRFAHESSDFLTLLNLWRFFHEQQEALSGSRLRKLCQANFLHFMRLREWQDIQRQLRGMAVEMKLHINHEPAPEDAVHRALLTGLISHAARLDERGEAPGAQYQGVRGGGIAIWPGSALAGKRPRWIVSAEQVRTTRLWARTVARIQPQWLEEVAAHLIRREHSDPRWDRASGRVIANERVTLGQLEISAARPVNYGPIDPARAREIFIHEALVEDDLDVQAPFLDHNRKLLARLSRLEDKARRHDIVADASARFGFYDRRIGPEVHSARALAKWRKAAERENPRVLFMRSEDLLAGDASDITPDRYPGRMPLAGTEAKLRYRFDPAAPDDGVTAVAPLEALPQLREADTQWLVPGLVEEKARELLRLLPKQLRRNIDAAACAKAFAAEHGQRDDRSLLEALSEHVGRTTGASIPLDAWRPQDLPEHLRLNVRIVDAAGRTLGEGRDVGELKRRLADEARRAVRGAGEQWGRSGVRSWDFGELPAEATAQRGGATITAYPGLEDAGDSVTLRLFETRAAADAGTRAGVRRLFEIAARRDLRQMALAVPQVESLLPIYKVVAGGADGARDLATLIAGLTFVEGQALPQSAEEFRLRVDFGLADFNAHVQRAVGLAAPALRQSHELALRLGERLPEAWTPALRDLRAQLSRLLYPGFLSATPLEWLARLPRYLEAARRRLDRLRAAGPDRDLEIAQEILPHWARAAALIDRAPGALAASPGLSEYRWMVEELRVSLFAQELGTVRPVSGKRMERLWDEVRGQWPDEVEVPL
ncbi:MAG: ATP-dependent RNA helicase HrpA [Phycisphaerales bacterium JB039]